MAGSKPSDNPRVNKLIELEVSGRIKPEHQAELDTYRAQGFAPKKSVGSATESERTAAFLGTRVSGAMGTLADIDSTDPDAARPPLMPELVRMVTPERFEEAAANAVTPESRQRVEAAQLELLDAALTLGTGAAYTREQLDGYRRSYFPQMGDDPKTIADKRQRLKVVVEAAKVKAGAAAPSIDQALAKAYAKSQTPSTTTADMLQLGSGNLIQDAVEGAAGPTQAQDMAGFEAELRRLYDSGADKATLEAFAKSKGQTLGGVDEAIVARDKGDKRLAVSAIPGAPVTPPNRGKGGFVETVDAGVRGAADVLTLGLADEIGALGSTIVDPDTTLRDNLDRERATSRYDEENNFGARLTGQIAGGLALPMGAARTPAALGRTSAGYGAAYGFGSGEGMADRFGGAAVGGVTGGALGYGAGRAGQALGARIARGGTGGGGGSSQALKPGREVVLAGDRIGVEVPPALTGPRAASWSAGLEQGPFTGPAIQARNATMQDQSRAAQSRIAGTVGNVADPYSMGESAARGAEAFKERTNKEGKRLYEAARRMAGQARPLTTRAVDQLTANIDELAVTPGINQSEIGALQTVLDDLSIRRPDGTIEAKYLPIDAMRGVRTQIRALGQTDAVRPTGFDRKARMAADAVSEDIVNGLKAAGKPEAAAAFRKADRYWRQRLETIDQTLTPIVGNPNAATGAKAPEAIVHALNNAAVGNSTRLAQFVRALPPEESAIVRATMIDRLGVPAKVAEDGADEVWSMQRFLSSWRQLSGRSKSTLFDPASRKAIDDLVTVAKEAERAGLLRNYPNTGRAVTVQGALAVGGSAVGAAMAGAPGALLTGMASIMAQQGAGKLMASPRFARQLAGIAKAKNPEAARVRIEGLRDIAAKESAIAPEILGFQQRLTEALVKEPASLAAAEENDE